MAETKYTYFISTDFPNHLVDSDTLAQQIEGSAITTALLRIDVAGDRCDIWFVDALSGGDQTTLDGIVAAHTGEPLPDSDKLPPPNTVFAGPLAELNAAITDADVDATDAPRTPTAHAGSHAAGQSDELLHGNLADVGTNSHAQLDTHVASSANPHSVTAAQAAAIPSSEKGTAGGVAELDVGGKIPAAQIPAVALPEVHVVADAAARLALTVQEGDEAIQIDDGSHWIYDGSTWYERPGGSGSGDVTGPASAADNAVVRFDGTTGKIIQSSSVVVDDSGNVSVPGTVDGRDVAADGTAQDNHIASTANPHSVTKMQVGLGNVENTKVNLTATTNPSVTDDSSQGYSVGSLWINTTTDAAFTCVDASVGAAVWTEGAGDGKVGVDSGDDQRDFLLAKLFGGAGIIIDRYLQGAGVDPIVMYPLDEASDGQGPTQAVDAMGSPYNLDLQYHGTSPDYFSEATGKGLEWFSTNNNGWARGPSPLTAGNKVYDALHGSQQASICCVVDIDAVTTDYSRLVHIGAGSNNGDFCMRTNHVDRVYVCWNNTQYAYYEVDFDTSGRIVLHCIVDTSQSVEANRIQLYKNGMRLTAAGGSFPPQNDTLSISGSSYLYLGNRGSGARSFDGKMYYAAVYDVAMAFDQIISEVSALLADDDSDPVPAGSTFPQVRIRTTGAGGGGSDPSMGKAITAYDSSGAQTFTGTIVANLDATHAEDDIYSLASDEITINDNGMFEITMDVSTGISSGSARSVSSAVLERDTGGGFEDVAGTKCFMYNRQSSRAENTGSTSVVLQVNAGTKFRIGVSRLSGSDTIKMVADGTRLTIKKLR
jgi:hypothetical protein